MKNKIKIYIITFLVVFLIFILLMNSNKPIADLGPHALAVAPLTSVPDSFTIIILPDTQYYSDKYPEIFTSQTKWIAENQKKLNIQLVVHLGDLVDNDEIRQWNNANKSISILEHANIPYSVIPGNHDVKEGFSYSSYDKYFPKERFENQSWFGGSFDNYRNNYQLLEINKYIFLNLDLCPNEKEIAWANQVLNNYSEYTAILTTHAYLDKSEPPKKRVKLCGSTQYIWDDLIKNHENLQLVFCGHIPAERIKTDLNLANKPVYQILTNYQNLENGGMGYLRIISFNNSTISVKTYSPYLNLYKIGNQSEFEINLDQIQ